MYVTCVSLRFTDRLGIYWIKRHESANVNRPIALSASKHQFKEIVNDFSQLSWIHRYTDRARARVSRTGLISVPNDCLKNARCWLPSLVLGFSTTTWKIDSRKFWRVAICQILPRISQILSDQMDNVRIFSPRSRYTTAFFFSLYINIINIKMDTRREKEIVIRPGVLGFKMIGVKLG